MNASGVEAVKDRQGFIYSANAEDGAQRLENCGRVRLDSGWGGAPSVRRLFGDERNIPAILEFLEKTKVGKMPSHILLAGGPDLEEEELERFSLQMLNESGEESRIDERREREDGPGPTP